VTRFTVSSNNSLITHHLRVVRNVETVRVAYRATSVCVVACAETVAEQLVALTGRERNGAFSVEFPERVP
jgi:hypothetical protein